MNESTRDEIITNMAENLPLLRMKSGFTQEKLAEMIGISRQTLIAIENKKRQMPWNTFLACLLVFNQNNDTKKLMELYGIYTEELSDYLGTKDGD